MLSSAFTIPIAWNKPAYLFYFGDLQHGTEGFDKEAWGVFKKEFLATPNSWAIGQGDYSDLIRPTMRARLLGVLAHDDSAREQQDNMAMDEYWKIADFMSFLKGRVVGLHAGHHDWTFADGTNGTQKLCNYLKTAYLGWMARIRFSFNLLNNSGVKTKKIFSLLGHGISMHGTGSALYPSTDSRWLENKIWPFWEADWYVRGHSTKLNAYPVTRNYPKQKGSPGNHEKIRWLINSGGFHRGYTDGWKSSYVERLGLPPSALGWSVLEVKIKQVKCKERKDDEMHCQFLSTKAWTRPIEQEEYEK